MGKALYREYRPRSLDAVVGQEHITKTLEYAIKKGSVSHAYLFTGPRGVGKTSVARILAYEINGIPYDEETTHLDIIEIDAASNRRIDEIRDLRDKVNIMPTSAKYKVYIIDEVHMLTREAFNALLKTLEEPPAHVVFILATTEAHKVPDTIISRTQRYSFKPIFKESAVPQLRMIADSEKLKITDDALELIADHGRGSFRDSISMLDQISSIASGEINKDDISLLLGIPNDDIISEIIDFVASNNTSGIFRSMQTLREQGSNPANIAQSVIKLLREHIIRNTLVLDSEKSVTIMKHLLPLTSTYSSYEGIEITLLDAMEFESDRKVIQKPKQKDSEEESKLPEIEKVSLSENNTNTIVATVAEKSTVEVVSELDDSSDSSWNHVLNILKTTHNTLYGVLRMAETDIDEDRILLTFQFEFHKKQLEQPKNLSTLKSIVNNELGDNFEIHSVVKKKLDHKPKQDKIRPLDDTLGNVSNIFGGAELLES